MASTSRTIVLIHGYGFVSRIWNPVEEAFIGYNVVRLSLPGFGDDPFSGPYSIESLAMHFWEELESQGESTVHLVGHSMGGYVCMEMLAQQPDRVASLCLLHSHVFADSEEKKKARTAILEEIQTTGREAFVRRMIGSMVFDKTLHATLIENLIDRGLLYGDDAWYNGTTGPGQHFDIARMRAIEQRRVVLRCANSGVTGAIAPDGSTLAQIPVMQQGACNLTVRTSSLRTVYGRIGDVIPPLGLLLSLILFFTARFPALIRKMPFYPHS